MLHLTRLPADDPEGRIRASGEASLGAAGEERLQLVAWALQRWGRKGLLLAGHASTDGGGPLALAERRVTTVRRWLVGFPDPLQLEMDDANSRIKLPKLGRLRLRLSQQVEGAVRSVDDVLGSPRRSRSDCLCSRLLHEFRFRHAPPPE